MSNCVCLQNDGIDMKCFTTGMSHEYECSRSGPNAGIGVVITSLLKQLWFTVVVFFPAATQLQQVRYGTLLSRCGRLAWYGMETGSERFASLTTFQSSKLNRSKGTNAHHLISSPACYHRTLECGTQRSRQPYKCYVGDTIVSAHNFNLFVREG